MHLSQLRVSSSRDIPRRSTGLVGLLKARVSEFIMLAKMLKYASQMEGVGIYRFENQIQRLRSSTSSALVV